jgi:hypothetical protein
MRGPVSNLTFLGTVIDVLAVRSLFTAATEEGCRLETHRTCCERATVDCFNFYRKRGSWTLILEDKLGTLLQIDIASWPRTIFKALLQLENGGKNPRKLPIQL